MHNSDSNTVDDSSPKKKTGVAPHPDSLRSIVSISVSVQEAEDIYRKARHAGKSVSGYLRAQLGLRGTRRDTAVKQARK
jgi:hypothetical protein